MKRKKEQIEKPLSVVAKIKLLRKAKGLNQDELGDLISGSQGKISKIEVDDTGYKADEIDIFRELFDIVDMPLTVDECAIFYEKLRIWRMLIKDDRLTEAEEYQKKLYKVVNLEPCDPDMAIYYRLLEISLLYAKEDLDTAKDKLNYLGGVIKKMSTDNLFFYYQRLGYLSLLRGDNKEAFDIYMKAYEIIDDVKSASQDDKDRLCYNIAVCHSRFGTPIRAIKFINKATNFDDEEVAKEVSVSMKMQLAVCYVKISDYDEAEKILNECYIQAKGLENDLLIGLALANLGTLHRRAANYNKAIEHLNQALDILKIGTDYYSWTFYYKVVCMIEKRDFAGASKVIEQEKDLHKTNKAQKILFETLKHVLTISKRMTLLNEKSVKYLEEVSIDFFIESNASLEAVSFYKLLEKYYANSRRHIKSNKSKMAIADIYEKMYRGGDAV